MRSIAFAVVVSVTLTAWAGDPQSLVETARASKEKRKKSTTKVITNADVKKAKGSVGENKPAAQPVAAPPQKSLVEQHETAYRERHAREAQRVAVAANVAGLERELAALEQNYYDENDLDRRDKDLVKRFNEVKAKLDAARLELDALGSEQ